MKTLIATSLPIILLAACQTAPVDAPEAEAAGTARGEVLYNPLERIGEPGRDAYSQAALVTGWLDGAWSNEAQYAFTPEEMKREPAAGAPYDWLDLQFAQFHTVDAPEIGDHVVYLEWRSDAADGPISRQRLWAFREDESGELTGMDFFTFRDPAPFAGRGAEPGAFTSLGPDDLIAYPEGCTLTARAPAWMGYVFDVRAGDCAITARSGRRMGIDALVEIAPRRIGYSEAGVLEDGSYAFLVPGGPAYDFRRVDPGDDRE
ncbi:MAG: CpcT/CpeT family chromophore lyase [Oceanicaulis sp.]